MTDKAFVTIANVGGHMAGEVIRFSADDVSRGVDVERLLALGAIREATPDESAAAVPYTHEWFQNDEYGHAQTYR